MSVQIDSLPAGIKLSGVGKRFGAYLLEGLLIVVTLVIGYVVWSLIVWSKGTTPAKQLLHMKVIWTADRRPATWARMLLREFVGKWLIPGALGAMLGLLTLGVGGILVGVISACLIFGAQHQALWDKTAATLVVDDPDNLLAAENVKSASPANATPASPTRPSASLLAPPDGRRVRPQTIAFTVTGLIGATAIAFMFAWIFRSEAPCPLLQVV